MSGCETRLNCMNYPEKCYVCWVHESRGENFYKPVDRSIRNNAIEERKASDKKAKKADKKNKRASDTSKRNKRAARAESDAIELIGARKTSNSGRKRRDGDGHTKNFLIDVKNQDTRENPIIDVDELDKARAQALMHNKQCGVLVIVNKSGRRFLVSDLEDGVFELNVDT